MPRLLDDGVDDGVGNGIDDEEAEIGDNWVIRASHEANRQCGYIGVEAAEKKGRSGKAFVDRVSAQYGGMQPSEIETTPSSGGLQMHQCYPKDVGRLSQPWVGF